MFVPLGQDYMLGIREKELFVVCHNGNKSSLEWTKVYHLPNENIGELS